VFIPRATVLVVEDHDDLRRMVEDLLISAGFDVYGVSNGAAALRYLRDSKPDAIVLDLMLPWVNGLEVLGTIREQPALSKLPVLVITATATTEYELQAFQPLAVLRKPLDVEAIVPLLDRLLTKPAGVFNLPVD
jgi:DNA-binding response OmpR family regulator